jgi:hypothetical protein
MIQTADDLFILISYNYFLFKYCKLEKKGCTRLTAVSDNVYQLLAHGRWFCQGTPASSTTKAGRHDIAESGVKQQKSNQII